jgi:arsenate reductase-like glutaredoxin family protein
MKGEFKMNFLAKHNLKFDVIYYFKKGYSEKEIINILSNEYTKSTIKKYIKIFCKKELEEGEKNE